MVLPLGETAPDFELPRLPDGSGKQETCRLADLLSGGPVVLCFVKENCPTCRFTLPFLDRMLVNYRGSRVSLRVIAQEGPAQAGILARELGLRIPVLLDEKPYPVSRLYRLAFVPTCYFIGEDGFIRHVMESFRRGELGDINQSLAAAAEVETLPFYTPIDGVPEFRPG